MAGTGRKRRYLALGLATAVSAPLAVWIGAAWHYTSVLDGGALRVERPEEEPNALVVDVTPGSKGTIRLAPLEGEEDGDWQEEGVYGLRWEGGYVVIGRILERREGDVERRLESRGATPAPGQKVRVDSFAYRGDPRQNFGYDFEEVDVPVEGGHAPAWLVPAAGDTWAIVVHGKGSSREESLRILPSLNESGLPVLVITYRGDPEYTAPAPRRHGYGASEWPDLAAALDYGAGRGARDYVLVGYSMGAGIVMALMQQPEYAPLVRGLILDSPVLDFEATIAYQAGRRGLPGLLTSTAQRLASLRFGIDWDRLDYLSRSESLGVPLLLFHGAEDKLVPVATSDELSQRRPDIVTYHRVAGAGHTRAWNADPATYEGAVRHFLGRISP